MRSSLRAVLFASASAPAPSVTSPYDLFRAYVATQATGGVKSWSAGVERDKVVRITAAERTGSMLGSPWGTGASQFYATNDGGSGSSAYSRVIQHGLTSSALLDDQIALGREILISTVSSVPSSSVSFTAVNRNGYLSNAGDDETELPAARCRRILIWVGSDWGGAAYEFDPYLATGPTLFLVPGGWTPASLGASLYDMWDAEDAAKFTLVGSAVSAWASATNSYSAAQATGAARPIYSATSFNGRPGVSFDGSDDVLEYTGASNFPTGATACELWALVDQVALAADTTTRDVFGYGNAAGVSRRVERVVTSGVNRAQGLIGTGSAVAVPNGSVDFSGRHVVRVIVGATSSQTDVDATAGSPVAAVPSTTYSRTRIGGSTATSAGSFFQGVVSFVAVTAPLSTNEASQMAAYLKARGGIA